MWTECADGHWLLGPLPSSDRVVIGAGCNGRGFRYAPAVAEALADFVEGKARPDPARLGSIWSPAEGVTGGIAPVGA